MTNTPDQPADTLSAAYQQFASVRQRFDRPGVARGGCPRSGVTPIYVRKFGAHAATIFPNLTTVESSFDAAQQRAVTTTLLQFKHWMTGQAAVPPLREQIVKAYLEHTRPFWMAALLHATKATLTEFLTTHPEHAPAMDAIFCVAGSEGIRDLIRLYDARVLEHTLAGTPISFPDILAFVNLHERMARTAAGQWQEERFEVWCPGYDLAKEYHQQCVEAAQHLVEQQRVPFVPNLAEEVQHLPGDLVAHLTSFVRTLTLHLLPGVTAQPEQDG